MKTITLGTIPYIANLLSTANYFKMIMMYIINTNVVFLQDFLQIQKQMLQTFLRDFLKILKYSLQNCKKIPKNCVWCRAIYNTGLKYVTTQYGVARVYMFKISHRIPNYFYIGIISSHPVKAHYHYHMGRRQCERPPIPYSLKKIECTHLILQKTLKRKCSFAV